MKIFNFTHSFIRQLKYELYPSRLLPSITAGLITGVISVIVSISLSALVFSGNLSSFISKGIGITLFSGVLLRIVVALMSSIPNPIATPVAGQMAILAVMATSIQSNPNVATPEEMFLSVVGAIALTSILTGAFLLALGTLKIGELIRVFPYSVIGGFIAGTGWLLVQGSIQLMTDVPLNFSHLGILFQPDIFLRWFSGLLFGIILVIISQRTSHFLVVPVSILISISLFYGLLLLTNTSVAQASSQGWLLGPFPKGSFWEPLTLEKLAKVNWLVVFQQFSNIITIIIISLISVILSVSGLEIVTKKDLDLNKELRVIGWANLVSGLSGGPVGSYVLPASALAYKMGAKSRLVGIINAALYAAVLLLDPSFLSIFPKPVIGGLTLYLGLSFLVEWLYNGWYKLPKFDYIIVVLIVFSVATIGFLEGVGIGLGAAVFLFVFEYSKIPIAKNVSSGSTYKSNVSRRAEQHQLLQEKGDCIYIIELQGFLFFGTSNHLINLIRERLSNSDKFPVEFLVLDFSLVCELDFSAVQTFNKIKQLAQNQGVYLVLIDLPASVSKKNKLGVFLNKKDEKICIFDSIDRGIEWCEEMILETV